MARARELTASAPHRGEREAVAAARVVLYNVPAIAAILREGLCAWGGVRERLGGRGAARARARLGPRTEAVHPLHRFFTGSPIDRVHQELSVTGTQESLSVGPGSLGRVPVAFGLGG